MLQSKVFNRLSEIDRDSWNGCFRGEIEDYDYLLAVEEAAISGFEWRYLTLWDNGRLIAAVPMFLTDYRLDTTLQGAGKKIADSLNKAFPKLLKLKLASLGSPCTETANFGFSAEIKDKVTALTAMLDYFEEYALGENYKLLGIKDIPEELAGEFEIVLKDKKYSALPGMPAANLPISFNTIDEYISQLSQKMRKDLRRKMKSFGDIRIETKQNIDDILPQIFELYKATRNRSEWQFEELTESYFKNVLTHMPGRSFFTLYYKGSELLAANLLVHNHSTLLDKFFCMGESGREYNLYFLSWLTNIETCLERGFKNYASGQNYGDVKTRLGSRLSLNTMFFKHRNPIAQGLLKLVAPLLSSDEIAETKEAA